MNYVQSLVGYMTLTCWISMGIPSPICSPCWLPHQSSNLLSAKQLKAAWVLRAFKYWPQISTLSLHQGYQGDQHSQGKSWRRFFFRPRCFFRLPWWLGVPFSSWVLERPSDVHDFSKQCNRWFNKISNNMHLILVTSAQTTGQNKKHMKTGNNWDSKIWCFWVCCSVVFCMMALDVHLPGDLPALNLKFQWNLKSLVANCLFPNYILVKPNPHFELI